jgi:hypothetical protein
MLCPYVGALTLTKIKDVFAIMKNLVLEGGAGGAGGGGGGGGRSGGGGAGGKDENIASSRDAGNEDTDKLVRQVKELKSLLLQRDSEIQILVNMVQKGKTVEDVSGAQMRASRGGGGRTGGMTGDDESESGYVSRGPRGGEGSVMDQSAAWARGSGRSFAEQQQLAQMQREKENQERLIKRHLFGVPPPTDRAVFDDAAGMYENRPMCE